MRGQNYNLKLITVDAFNSNDRKKVQSFAARVLATTDYCTLPYDAQEPDVIISEELFSIIKQKLGDASSTVQVLINNYVSTSYPTLLSQIVDV